LKKLTAAPALWTPIGAHRLPTKFVELWGQNYGVRAKLLTFNFNIGLHVRDLLFNKESILFLKSDERAFVKQRFYLFLEEAKEGRHK
jgi:hypothetical protein